MHSLSQPCIAVATGASHVVSCRLRKQYAQALRAGLGVIHLNIVCVAADEEQQARTGRDTELDRHAVC